MAGRLTAVGARILGGGCGARGWLRAPAPRRHGSPRRPPHRSRQARKFPSHPESQSDPSWDSSPALTLSSAILIYSIWWSKRWSQLPVNDELVWDNGTPFPEPCVDRLAPHIDKVRTWTRLLLAPASRIRYARWIRFDLVCFD
jgi:hypothetical protein